MIATRCQQDGNQIELLECFGDVCFQVFARVNTKVTAGDAFFGVNHERKWHGIMAVA
jgi:hypothetical protein